MKTIPLTKGMVAIIDDDDYEIINQFSWHCSTKGYAQTSMRLTNGKYRSVKMHRLILDAPDGVEVDHANRDKLDNRRCNIRLCTTAQNQHNRIGPTGAGSVFTGVYWNKHRGRWHARIRINGKRLDLGYFINEIEAAKAYDSAALEHFGAFARCNFPLSLENDIQVERPAADHVIRKHRRPKSNGHSSQYRGVNYEPSRRKWRAQISIGNKSTHLGRFVSEEEAARVYDAAAIAHFGNDAYTNFPIPDGSHAG